MMKRQDTLNAYIAQAIRDNWNRPAMSNFHGDTYTFSEIAVRIAKLHIAFEHAGIKPGDKIALCGKNCAEWATAALACITYGAVAVPILNEFKPDTIAHLVNHSDARIFFVDSSIWEDLDADEMKSLLAVIYIHDFSMALSRSKKISEVDREVNKLFGERYPSGFTSADVHYPELKGDTLALINYTSGSMGFSKGVMLSYESLWSNIQFSIDGLQFLLPGDGFVSMLPLAHMFGLAIELLHPFVKGCHIYFLGRTPSPRILLEAFSEVKPKLIITVPLVLEKIVKSKVFPVIQKPVMRFLLCLPLVKNKIYAKIRATMLQAFGGQLRQVIIGGASLNPDVASFLRKIKFPFTVGYGMTECGPLITYAPWEIQRPGSCGKFADRMEGRIDSPDPANVPGTLWVRGANVMEGYYKNPEATAEVFKDGWMNTGDLCTIDKDGFLYIRGRDKNMILGPSGQNIYPEEIEQKLNNLPLVAESLVVSRDNKLIALIVPDREEAKKDKMTEKDIEAMMNKNIAVLNDSLPDYSKVSGMEIMSEEFEKTPKRSIRRYLYK